MVSNKPSVAKGDLTLPPASDLAQYAAFPKLPASVFAGLPPDLVECERICALPDSWDSLAPRTLCDVVVHALLIYGATQDIARVQSVQDLYGVAVQRLSVQDRIDVGNRVAEHIEESRRNGRFVATLALLPGMHLDPDPRVVGTASLNTAVLMGSGPRDSMMGRRNVRRSAMEMSDPYRRAWILGGLITLGDAETLGLLRRCWVDLPSDCRDHLCDSASQLNFASVADFLLLWAEDAMDIGDESEMARALGALGDLARIGRGEVQGRYSGRGICVILRRFPAWAHPSNEVIQERTSWSSAEFGRILEPRLRALAGREREAPRIAEDALKVWGLG
jgi:hypothetical protein